MRRSDIGLYLGPADRAELQALTTNRNTPRKLVWRAGIVLATADGHGTFEIMQRTGMSKPTVWRWQARYLDEGVAGLKRDKTRPSRVLPLPMETRLKVIAKTVQETPPNAMHWSRTLMAEAMGISPLEEQQRQNSSARGDEKRPLPGQNTALSRSDLPCSRSLRLRRRHSGRITLVPRLVSGDLHIKRHATWGISGQLGLVM